LLRIILAGSPNTDLEIQATIEGQNQPVTVKPSLPKSRSSILRSPRSELLSVCLAAAIAVVGIVFLRLTTFLTDRFKPLEQILGRLQEFSILAAFLVLAYLVYKALVEPFPPFGV